VHYRLKKGPNEQFIVNFNPVLFLMNREISTMIKSRVKVLNFLLITLWIL